MLTDPALDAGRHEFELRTLLGRVLPPEEMLKVSREEGWMPPVREIYPLIIGSMSFGALSPNMWEGLQMGVAYLNEELGMPVRICTGEGGCPPRLLKSRFLKYVILQIASGYFGWDEITDVQLSEGDPWAYLVTTRLDDQGYEKNHMVLAIQSSEGPAAQQRATQLRELVLERNTAAT